MKNNTTQLNYTTKDVGYQQMMLPIDTGIMIPEDDPVRLLSAELEELNYEKLYRAYSPKGRKSVTEPRVIFKVMVNGYMNGIYASRKLETACRKNIDFMWLLEGEKVPDHNTFARFRTGRLKEAVEDLFYQYVRLLEDKDETDHESVFIDGTKLESRANKYTFVWRGSIEKNLEKVREAVRQEFERRGIEGNVTIGKLRTLVEQETMHLKESGHELVSGRGHRKTPDQRVQEKLLELLTRWEGYEEKLEIMGKYRNSYSKTDPDATFMHMKEDHMRNGQLKPGYNVQLAVNSEYITGVAAFANRTDSGTLVPFLKKLEYGHCRKYDKIVADAGYESADNYLYLESQGQMSFIKPVNYEYSNSKKFKAQIGRRENMRYDETEDCYYCAAGRALALRREKSELTSEGYVRTTAYYYCDNCGGCEHKDKCFKSKKYMNKQLKVQRGIADLGAKSLQNIMTPEGITLRLNRSIQVEGAFGVIKHDRHFRRFLTRGKNNTSIELYLLCLAYNINKLHTKTLADRRRTHLFEKLIS
jgi:transposase